MHAASPSHGPEQTHTTRYYEGGAGVQPPTAGRSADAIASQFLGIEAELEQQSDVRDGDKSVKLSAIHNLAQSFASGECDRNLCL